MAAMRTITRNGKRYYYLEHSVREGNKVKMERIYLGSKIPDDIQRVKENFETSLLEKRYSKNLESIKKSYKSDFDSMPQTAKDKYIESFLVKFTYNTNRMEGSTLSLKETYDLLEEGISPSNKPMADIKETEGHKKAFYEMLKFRQQLDLGEVLHWHKVIFNESNIEIAGKIRSHGVAIARSKVKLALPAEIEPMLHDFFIWYKESKANPVIKAALAHLRFVTIHPFTDGNGRISRLLMNYVLHSNGYPMVNIEYGNRQAYYNALEKSQLMGTVAPFINFLVKRFLKEHGPQKPAKKV